MSRGDIKKESENSYKTLCELCQSEIEICVVATRGREDAGSVEFWQEILAQNGKQKFDKEIKNKWFNICLDEAGDNQDNSVKREIAKHLEEQSEQIAEAVEQIIQEK